MKKIVVATKNEGKVKEILAAFQKLPVELLTLKEFGSLPEAVEDADTFEGNARIKARYYREKTGLSALADDSGLAVEVLDGAPGVYSARYAGVHGDDAANNQKLIAELRVRGEENACAAYHCALVLALDDGRELSAEGTCRGFIRPAARGTEGFGYDPHFYRADGRSMAELSRAEKHAISHRGAALEIMKKNLRERGT